MKTIKQLSRETGISEKAIKVIYELFVKDKEGKSDKENIKLYIINQKKDKVENSLLAR